MKARLRSTPLRLKTRRERAGAGRRGAHRDQREQCVLFLRSYLVRLVDDQLHQIANDANAAAMFVNGGEVTVPTDYYGRVTAVSGVGKDPVYDGHLGLDDLPPQVEGREEITAVAGEAYTVKSINGKIRWRMLVQELPNGEVLHIGRTWARSTSRSSG